MKNLTAIIVIGLILILGYAFTTYHQKIIGFPKTEFICPSGHWITDSYVTNIGSVYRFHQVREILPSGMYISLPSNIEVLTDQVVIKESK